MKLRFKQVALALAAAGALVAAGGANAAGAYISNGLITLGVNDLGALNVAAGAGTGAYPGVSVGGTAAVGLRYNSPTGGSYASTEPGCTCEGWGAAIVSTGATGYQNTSVGTGGLTLVSFTSTATTATSVTKIGNSLEVTHVYKPSAVAGAYEVDVSIKNISGVALAAGDLRYRRVMDWDIEPTAFSEFVTMHGVPAALGISNGSNLRRTGDNGFASSNPLTDTSGSLGTLSSGQASISCPANSNFTDCGTDDHGALFDFEFGAVGIDGVVTFTTYYGASGTEAGALADLATLGADIYSLGESAGHAATGVPATFYFAFGGKEGVLDPVTDVPEPASLALAALGLVGLAGMRLRRKA